MKRSLSFAIFLGCFVAACGGGGGGGHHVVGPVEPIPPTPTPDEPVVPQIPLATGSGVKVLPEPKAPFFLITSYGAVSQGPALTNQAAINAAVDAAAAAGGGTVIVPSGDFKSYTIRLKSNVTLHLASKDSILRAAVPKTGAAENDGGNYDAPEVNLFVGLQDQGHSHWANSLIYGVDIENVMISGPGLIDGSYVNASGYTVNVLSGNDPGEVTDRTKPYDIDNATDANKLRNGNKAIALKNVKNVVMRDFSILNGGHFAIIGTGVIGWTMDGIIVDTNRDALDVDASQDVTIRNSVFNSLTDDAIVLKASFGLGRYLATQNVLIEDTTVSGYDAGSVLAGVYSTQKLVATDACGPTARIKLGTEGTTGFNTVTIRNVLFDRSRGFALESVDGAVLKDIVMDNVRMKNVSSSPIFIRIGDRGRAPVTGISSSTAVSPSNNVRLDDTGWILPNLPEYGSYPPVRYIPSYTTNQSVAIGGANSANFSIVNPTNPTRLNANSINPTDLLFANAVGVGFAQASDIKITNVTIENADPRYPILLAGLVDHPIENVYIANVSVQYRGGLKMEHAIEQRQLNQSWAYSSYGAAAATQNIPWLSNTFFAKKEALLPRVSWNPSANGGLGAWENDPYNIPEMPREYPEPSLFGVLPAYGLYARHVNGLTIRDVKFSFMVEDERPAVVLDDVDGANFDNFAADIKSGVPVFVTVTNSKKREVDREYVKDLPYKTTTVNNLTVKPELPQQSVTVDRPAPGTPPDSLYTYPTAPDTTYPYSYAVASATYPKPLTVYRPSFNDITGTTARENYLMLFTVSAKAPGGGTLTYSAESLPQGASFDPGSGMFMWTPAAGQAGKYTVKFTVNDGVLPESKEVPLTVTP